MNEPLNYLVLLLVNVYMVNVYFLANMHVNLITIFVPTTISCLGTQGQHFTSMASKPIDIRWIRTGSQPN